MTRYTSEQRLERRRARELMTSWVEREINDIAARMGLAVARDVISHFGQRRLTIAVHSAIHGVKDLAP